ncbi:MAG: hypothetical protein R3B47_06215 [Bacteroidia bacterium]
MGTSKNGSASYAGSLQFQSPDLNQHKYSKLGIGYGSFNSYRVYGEYKSRMKNKSGLYVRGSHLHADGYKRRSANTSSSVFYKTKLDLAQWDFTFTGFAGMQANKWPGSLPLDTIELRPRANANSQENDRFTQSLNYLTAERILAGGYWKTTLYYNYLNGNYDFDLNNFLGLPSTDELYNYAFRSNWQSLFSTWQYPAPDFTWTNGIHVSTYSRRHRGTEASLGELYTNSVSKCVQRFFQNKSGGKNHITFTPMCSIATAISHISVMWGLSLFSGTVQSKVGSPGL